MAAATPNPVVDPSGDALPSPGYRRYALGLLLVVYVFNFIDRQVLGILAEPIKNDLDLSDTQLGFLTGIAFALLYTFAGIPIARWADSGPRRTIIALGLAAWSAATAASGFARNFVQMTAARVGVGLGEAACSPPAHSLISDYFPPESRATALSIYSLGIPIGGAIGYVAGGWINEFFGWRMAFMVVGLPGVALAILVRLTLREPSRGQMDRVAAAAAGLAQPRAVAQATVRETRDFLLKLRSFVHLAFAGALHAFVGYGAAAFHAPFLMRVHEFGSGELGTYLAGIAIVGGGLGTYLGGRLSDALASRNVRYYLWVPGISTLVAIPFQSIFYVWPQREQALLFLVPAAMMGSMYLGPTFALTQSLAKPQMRATAAAILLFIINLIGLGLGPQFVGWVSDLLAPRFGVESIRYSLLVVVAAGSLWSGLHYWLAARTIEEDLEAKDRE